MQWGQAFNFPVTTKDVQSKVCFKARRITRCAPQLQNCSKDRRSRVLRNAVIFLPDYTAIFQYYFIWSQFSTHARVLISLKIVSSSLNPISPPLTITYLYFLPSFSIPRICTSYYHSFPPFLPSLLLLCNVDTPQNASLRNYKTHTISSPRSASSVNSKK